MILKEQLNSIGNYCYKKMKISVMIVTKNRPRLLETCLTSLVKQTLLPDEVVVIDGSGDKSSGKVVNCFKNDLSIVYKKESRGGIARARNLALKTAKGELLVFIDDDGEAQKDWLQAIVRLFNQDKSIDVVMGRCINFYEKNIFALVQQAYYDRWLEENIDSGNRLTTVKSAYFGDFENIAFRSSFIKKYRCSLDLPFGGFSEDIELAFRMWSKGVVVFNSDVLVKHKHQRTFWGLIKRNWQKGYADQTIFLTKKIDVFSHRNRSGFFGWLKKCLKGNQGLSVYQKGLFLLVLLIYPFFYRLGRWWARLTHR